MNYYILLGLNIAQLIALMIYFLITRKTVRQLIVYGMHWKTMYENTQREFNLLNDQYRQLSKINEAHLTVSKLLVKNRK